MELEQTLRMACLPREPAPDFEDAVMARVSSAAWRASRDTRRRPGRIVLLGVILVVAAAAAMLAAQLINPLPPASVAAPVPASVVEHVEPLVAASPPPLPGETGPGEVAAPVRPFTVGVLPLVNDSPDAAVREAVNTFHDSLLDGLRSLPGLTLLALESEESAGSVPADYLLTVKGTGSSPGNSFTISLRANAVGRYVMPFQISGLLVTDCAGTPGCGDPVGMAARQLDLLRNRVFPRVFPAPQPRPQELRDRLLDPALSERQRLDALKALGSIQGEGGGTQFRDEDGISALRDPAVVRGAIELAAAATEADVRAQAWKMMRGVQNPDLVQPLIAAAREDSSSDVRAEAVLILTTGFADDPRVGTALEAIAHQESRPLVRALAQGGLDGEAWGRHVVASLKDATLSDAERIEALYYDRNLTGRDLREVLTDDEAIRAFAQVLPRAADSLPGGKTSAVVLVSRLDSIDHPAITDMLLDAYEHPEWVDRIVTLNQLTRRSANPRVRTLLEKISTDAADSPLREIAIRALNIPAVPAGR